MTNSNQKPPAPNYVPNVGRLVADRFDFQAHINGSGFRHQAPSIDLFPTLVVGSSTVSTVQDALTAINTLIGTSPIQPASASALGTVQLSPSGDVRGTATQLRVVNIQGIPISTLPPSSGQVLTFSGSSWAPANVTTNFTANGDLAGSVTVQTVVGLTGVSNTISIHGNNLTWDLGKIPLITQANSSSGVSGNNLSIVAQLGNNSNGGNVILQGGNTTGAFLNGGVSLKSGDGAIGLQYTNLGSNPTNQRVLSLVGSTTLTSTQMPSGTGDLVIFVGDTGQVPTPGILPVGGTIMYSSGGKLNITQGDGNNFIVGQLTYPAKWLTTGTAITSGSTAPTIGSVLKYEYGGVLQTTTNIAQTVNFIIGAAGSAVTAQVDLVIVGNSRTTPTNAACYTLKMGYTTDNSQNVTAVGTVTTIDSRHTAGAAGWTAPNITTTGTSGNVRISTGFNTAETIVWSIDVIITTSH